MNIVAALLLFGHGFAHVVGFVVPWRLATLKEMPYTTTILAGRVDAGDIGIRILGVVWLLLALAFAAVAVGAVLHAPWWPKATLVVSAASLVMCVIGLPDAKFGIPVNIVIIAALLIGMKAGWAFMSA